MSLGHEIELVCDILPTLTIKRDHPAYEQLRSGVLYVLRPGIALSGLYRRNSIPDFGTCMYEDAQHHVMLLTLELMTEFAPQYRSVDRSTLPARLLHATVYVQPSDPKHTRVYAELSDASVLDLTANCDDPEEISDLVGRLANRAEYCAMPS